MLLIDTDSGQRYKMLRWGNIKAGDTHLLEDDGKIEVTTAEYDYPDNFGSFILEPVDSKIEINLRRVYDWRIEGPREGWIYKLLNGQEVLFKYMGSTGLAICCPPGEPDTQSSFGLHLHNFIDEIREATPEERGDDE